MNKETLCDFARINRHVRNGCNFETTVDWLLDCGFSKLQISQWIAATHMKEATLARNWFSALRANKNNEDFFKRVESHGVATKANSDQRLMLLQLPITRNDIRRNIQLSIVHRRLWDDLKKTCFRDFGKQLPYRIKEDWAKAS
jgi:hypothetical protein